MKFYNCTKNVYAQLTDNKKHEAFKRYLVQ